MPGLSLSESGSQVMPVHLGVIRYKKFSFISLLVVKKIQCLSSICPMRKGYVRKQSNVSLRVISQFSSSRFHSLPVNRDGVKEVFVFA